MAVSSVIVVSSERVSGTDELPLKNVTVQEVLTDPAVHYTYYKKRYETHSSLACMYLPPPHSTHRCFRTSALNMLRAQRSQIAWPMSLALHSTHPIHPSALRTASLVAGGRGLESALLQTSHLFLGG